MVQENLVLQQASGQRKFADMTKDISASLLQVISGIVDLDIAAGTIENNYYWKYIFFTTIVSWSHPKEDESYYFLMRHDISLQFRMF